MTQENADIAAATDGYDWCHGAGCLNTATHIVEVFGRRGRRCDDCLKDHGAFEVVKTFDDTASETNSETEGSVDG